MAGASPVPETGESISVRLLWFARDINPKREIVSSYQVQIWLDPDINSHQSDPYLAWPPLLVPFSGDFPFLVARWLQQLPAITCRGRDSGRESLPSDCRRKGGVTCLSQSLSLWPRVPWVPGVGLFLNTHSEVKEWWFLKRKSGACYQKGKQIKLMSVHRGQTGAIVPGPCLLV